MTAATLDPSLAVAGSQLAQDLGLWALHTARTHPRLADVVGWARVQAALLRSSGQAKIWVRFANWLEQLDPARYPEQIAMVLDQNAGATWRGRSSPKPPISRSELASARNAKPLPVCSACNGLGTEVA